MRTVLIVATAIFLIGCAAPFSTQEDRARQELLELAPLNSDARIAKAKLESKGFVCAWKEQSEFEGLEGKHNYLYCNNESLAGFLISRRWQLALIHKNYLVQDAKFGISLTGL